MIGKKEIGSAVTDGLKLLYRQGWTFRRSLAELRRTERYSSSQLEAWQLQKLQFRIAQAYEEIPYWRDCLMRINKRPDDIKSLEHLQMLPVLTKQVVREQYDRLINPKRRNRFSQQAQTSGTTGTPLQLLRDYRSINVENAHLWRQWGWAGDTGKRRVTLRGEMVVPTSQQTPPFWRVNPWTQELVLSAFHFSTRNSALYLRKVQEHGPRVLYAYPTMALLLAKTAQAEGVKLRFDSVVTSSEMVDAETRSTIEQVFRTTIVDWYGQAERVSAVGQCEHGTYHIIEDYGIIEALPCADGSGQVRLIGTSLDNAVMPLFRYDTSDLFELDETPCQCSRQFRRVKRIVGRPMSHLVTPEGAKVPMHRIVRGVPNILESQFVQRSPGAIEVLVTTTPDFGANDEALLITNAKAFTSPNMRVAVRVVPEIPRGPNGKYQAVLQYCTEASANTHA